MTLSTFLNTKVYNGNGVTDTFSFPYKFFKDSHLVVTVDGVKKTLGIHYNVTGAGLELGGDVIFTAGNIPPATAVDNVSIQRILPLDQDADPQNFDGNPADSTEQVYDTIVMQMQQIADDVKRAPKVPISENYLTVFLPNPLDGHGVIWDGDLGVLRNTTSPLSVLEGNAATVATNIANVNIVATNISDVNDVVTNLTAVQNASSNAAAAAASATAASSSETASGLSETNANNSETAAAASAAAAAATLESAPLKEITNITSADSPYDITQSHNGHFVAVDTSGGNVVLNILATLSEPFNFRVKKETADGNTVTLALNATEEFSDGTTSKIISSVGGFDLVLDEDVSPDQWKFSRFGASAGDVTIDTFLAGTDYTAGTDNELTLSAGSGSENNVTVTFGTVGGVDGATVHHTQFNVSGTTLTFTDTIPTSVTEVEVRYGTTLAVGVTSDNSVTWLKLASSVIASVADMVAGTASKIISAANFKSYMDTYVHWTWVTINADLSSGTPATVTLPSIPDTVKEIEFIANGVSTSDTYAGMQFTVYDDGVEVTTGYGASAAGFVDGNVASDAYENSAFYLYPGLANTATRACDGIVKLTRISDSNSWMASGGWSQTDESSRSGFYHVRGIITLTGDLTQIDLFPFTGTWDDGALYARYR